MQTPTQTQVITLGECLAAIVAEAAVRSPALASRLESAVKVLDRGITQRVFPSNPDTGDYWVESKTTVGQMYSVSIRTGACTCLDYQHRGGPCAHLLAVRLLSAASFLRRERQMARDWGLVDAMDTAPLVARLVCGEVAA